MPDINDLFYHGIRESMRLVLNAMGEERLDKGLTAFEDGSHDWSNCFFARAFKGELNLHSSDPEGDIARVLKLYRPVSDPPMQPNRLPIRTIWHTFDNASTLITAAELRQFITDVRDEKRPDDVMRLLRSLRPEDVDRPITPHECGVNA